jgi:hypothetical protein
MSSIWAEPKRPRIRAYAGGAGYYNWLDNSCAHRAQLSFDDLPPYICLTYGLMPSKNSAIYYRRVFYINTVLIHFDTFTDTNTGFHAVN